MNGFLVYYGNDDGIDFVKVFTSYKKAKSYFFKLIGEAYVNAITDEEDFEHTGFSDNTEGFYLPTNEENFSDYVQVGNDLHYWSIERIEIEND